MGNQEKPLVYQFYKSLTHTTLSGLRKGGGRRFRKMSDSEILRLMLNEIDRSHGDAINTIDYKTFVEEHYWAHSGKRAVFPESREMIDQLLTASYKSVPGAIFDFPFRSFVLAIPKGVVFMGEMIPSCLVTIGDYQGFSDEPIDIFSKYIGVNTPNIYFEDMPEGTKQIGIVYKDPLNPLLSVQFFMTSDKWADILKCKSPEEYQKKFTDYAGDTTLKDAAIQLILLKLVAGIGVYNSATNGEFLKEGLPGKDNKLRIECSSEMLPKKSYMLRDGLGLRHKSGHETAEHYRTWHFRNLRDKRYYTGDYEKLEPGSRWVFVSDTMVNEEVDAYTAKEV